MTSEAHRPPVPTLALNVPNFGDHLVGGPDPAARLVAVAQDAEAAGFDRLFVTDHVLLGRHTDAYRWGDFPVGPEAPWLEPLTTLALLCGATRTIRLGTGILQAALRGATLLAKTVATLDVLSGGRIDLGVGTGWQKLEFDAAGVDFPARGAALDDVLATCQALWRDAPASVARPTVRFDDAWSLPHPVQAGGVPVWVAGSASPAVVRRLVAFGQGWLPIMGITPEGIADGLQVIGRAFEEAGRDVGALQVRGRLRAVHRDDGSVDATATADQLPALLAAGVTDASITLQELGRDREQAAEAMRVVVTAFRDRVGR